MFHKPIYKAGVKRRNPSLMPYLDFLMESDKWSIEQLSDYQLKKCKDLLEFAQKYSPFYREHFDRCGFEPSKMRSLEDLKKIPPIDKQVLLTRNGDIQSTYRFAKLFFSETSGTSGQVLKFYRNEEWDSCNRAAMFRGYKWYGVSPWDRNGYFWGYNIDKSQRLKTAVLDELQNRFRIFSYDEDHIRKFADKLRNAVYVGGYSSMIYEVAKIVNRLGINNDFHLKMVKGTSEKIYSSYQNEVKEAFGQKIISEYGSAESGLIAFECPEGGHMHINMENVIVEEENNEIIVTNLLSKSFPIIRYKLGDAITLAPSDFKCKCGRQHPVLLDVIGRVGKSIIGKQSAYPSLTFYYIFKNLAFKGIDLNYQAVQEEKGKIVLKIEQDQHEYLTALQNELQKYFHEDIDFEIRWGEHLHSMNGKLKDFITSLN